VNFDDFQTETADIFRPGFPQKKERTLKTLIVSLSLFPNQLRALRVGFGRNSAEESDGLARKK
jgi:hypothetical protein